MTKITPSLWFDGNAEEAAEFYVSLFPNSRIDKKVGSASDNPSTKKGEILVVEFVLDGQKFIGINGGPAFKFTEAISFSIDCADQAEVDRYWDALTANGGAPSQCGWCKDRFGLSWQVVPKRLSQLLASQDRAAAERAMQAMLKMTKIEVAALEAAVAG
ncbi:VOC family protein [Devosia algicola]|uniref:VOC family protein n=1 Tax=Devosia algicola TaxID=3026418 RepID=A0ABY7YRD5_9HYPH|nr:VOC family protein [Devosia algicola]WDR03893.1 VOC family protein [Devosia algicola]